MGLLDAFDSPQGRLGLSLLSAAGPMQRPMSFGQRLGMGVGQFDQWRNEQEDRAEKKRLLEAKLAEMMSLAEVRNAQIEDAKAKRAAEQEAATRRGNFLGSMDQNAGPAMPYSLPAALAAGLHPQEASMLAPQRRKVARVEEMMIDGKPTRVQFDDEGQPMGVAMPQWKAPTQLDTGGSVGFMDPVTLSILAQVNKSNSPDALLSAGTARRGQDMADARSREANAQNGGMKAPPGYRFKADGSLEAIPGGPADIKAGELGDKKAREKQNIEAGANSVLDTVAEAKGLASGWTTGLGGLTASIPATPGRDLQAKLATIKANLGFDRLQEMRAASPTGGALGQVAVQELQALQATVASLDQLQSPTQVKAALDKIEKHYTRWLEVSGGKRQGGASGSFDSQNGFRVLGKE